MPTSQFNIPRAREHLQNFQFTKLFVTGLNWENPPNRKAQEITVGGETLHYRHVAALSGVVVLEFEPRDDAVHALSVRKAVHKAVEARHREHLLIFVDSTKSQCCWSWEKHEAGKLWFRDHKYMKGQTGDLFISQLSNLFFELSDFDDEGDAGLTQVAERLQTAFDVERVTKKFYTEFDAFRMDFAKQVLGIEDERTCLWYTSILLNRLMFIWFLQKKNFVNDDMNYLLTKLQESKTRGADRFYVEFLQLLFFEGFAKPSEHRSRRAQQLLGKVRYLNGGLFVRHEIELKHPAIQIPDRAFENLFALFGRYTWHLDDTPGGQDDEINPQVLGYIFEKYINQRNKRKDFGAYYTCSEITEYLCKQTIHRLLLKKARACLPGISGARKGAAGEDLPDVLMRLDAAGCRSFINTALLGEGAPGILDELSVLDPACGSGAFLVAAMKTLIDVYGVIIGRIEVLGDRNLKRWLGKFKSTHKSLAYGIKKQIITNNLFGVDLMGEAVEICKLRLFLALVSSAQAPDDLEPLPNIDFNILPGNSLIGIFGVGDEKLEKNVQPTLGNKKYSDVVKEHERQVRVYRGTTYSDDLQGQRDNIEKLREWAAEQLNPLLLDRFDRISYEKATWNQKARRPGKPKKRAVSEKDLAALTPFHWDFEFNSVFKQRGGFDVVLMNPPWEIFKPNGKEFFERYSEFVTKKKMQIEVFEKHQKRELQNNPGLLEAWLEYLSFYPHQSAWFRSDPQYQHQSSVVVDHDTGKTKSTGSDLNLYKLFLEQCFNLLRDGGQCGVIIPSGVYTDLGAKGLREMLFEKTKIGGLFCFENRKRIFEDVHRSFKFVVLTFEKGQPTMEFPAAFMRHEVSELKNFPHEGGVKVPVSLVKKLSPDSLSVMEFRNDTDRAIVEKAARFPLLGERMQGAWNVRFHSEFHMTNDSGLFHTRAQAGCLPLYEGKMVHQFNHQFAPDALRYWVNEKEGRRAILGRVKDDEQHLGYQEHRLGFRSIASSTNERTLITTILPPAFHGNNFPTLHLWKDTVVRGKLVERVPLISNPEQIFLCAILNSFTLDYFMRMKVSANLNHFHMNQLPVPRLTEQDAAFHPIVNRAAKLICTTPEFDVLAKEAGLAGYQEGVTETSARDRLRSELDALVAHLYGLSEVEFVHILNSFPLVGDPVRTAAQNAYRDAERGLVQ